MQNTERDHQKEADDAAERLHQLRAEYEPQAKYACLSLLEFARHRLKHGCHKLKPHSKHASGCWAACLWPLPCQDPAKYTCIGACKIGVAYVIGSVRCAEPPACHLVLHAADSVGAISTHGCITIPAPLSLHPFSQGVGMHMAGT